MKLKDTLPQTPLLVEITDKKGGRHCNFAAVQIPLGENNDHVLYAHHSEFLPANQPELKNRVRKFLDEVLTYTDESRTTLVSDELKQTIADQLFAQLMQDLQSNKDVVIVKNPQTDEISTIKSKAPLEAIEAAYRKALPQIAKHCGVLFETDTLRMPAIVITDNQDISSLVPHTWPEKAAGGFAYKSCGIRTTPDCDAILLAHGQAGFYEEFLKSAKHPPDLRKAIVPTLAHELTHHLGLDELAKGETPLLPLLKADREYTKGFLGKLLKAATNLQGPVENQAIIDTFNNLGLLTDKPALLQTAMQIHSPGKEVNIGRSIKIENLGTSAVKLQGVDRRYLKELLQEVINMVDFAHQNASIPIITSAQLASTGQDINDEMLPSVMTAQSELGADATRILFPNTYPPLQEIMQRHGVDITHSLSLAIPEKSLAK